MLHQSLKYKASSTALQTIHHSFISIRGTILFSSIPKKLKNITGFPFSKKNLKLIRKDFFMLFQMSLLTWLNCIERLYQVDSARWAVHKSNNMNILILAVHKSKNQPCQWIFITQGYNELACLSKLLGVRLNEILPYFLFNIYYFGMITFFFVFISKG